MSKRTAKVQPVSEEVQALIESAKASAGARKQSITVGDMSFDSKKEAILYFDEKQSLSINQISKLLNVRYQHVRSVVFKYGSKSTEEII